MFLSPNQRFIGVIAKGIRLRICVGNSAYYVILGLGFENSFATLYLD